MKKNKGFTLVELIIVIVIVGILSIVAVPIYRGYTMRAIASEGKALMGSIKSAQNVYYSQYGQFVSLNYSPSSPQRWFGVEAKTNRYFNSYDVSSGGTGYLHWWNAQAVDYENGLTVYASADDYTGYTYLKVIDRDGYTLEEHI